MDILELQKFLEIKKSRIQDISEIAKNSKIAKSDLSQNYKYLNYWDTQIIRKVQMSPKLENSKFFYFVVWGCTWNHCPSFDLDHSCFMLIDKVCVICTIRYAHFWGGGGGRSNNPFLGKSLSICLAWM